jgi:hypothetical protein
MTADVIRFPESSRPATPRDVCLPQPQAPYAPRKNRREVVRFTFHAKVYEVIFDNGEINRISHVCTRIQNGRVVEVRYGKLTSWRDSEPELVVAARAARRGPARTKYEECQEMVAQLSNRRAELFKKIAEVEAMAAKLERELPALATADEA